MKSIKPVPRRGGYCLLVSVGIDVVNFSGFLSKMFLFVIVYCLQTRNYSQKASENVQKVIQERQQVKWLKIHKGF